MANIKLANLNKSYGNVHILKDINLDIKSGEFMVFVGPSGCGKSTLLRTICGLENISSGTLEIDNAMVNNVPPSKRGIAMVFQSYALYPHMSVFENIGFALENQGLDAIPVTGQDATVGGIQNVLAGKQSMTVYKAIKAEAEAAAALAIALLNGEDTAAMATGSVNNGTNDVPSVLLVPVSVTKDNVAETVIADGFRTWEEICVGDFEQFCPADR